MKNIIIYSRSAEFRALIQEIITDPNLNIVQVSSRTKLFALCNMTKMDLLLTDDVRMFMNGSDAMIQIRRGGFLPQIFVLSYDISEETVTALLEMGINQFISLPVMTKKLQMKIAVQYHNLV